MSDVKAARVALASDQALYLRGMACVLLNMPGMSLVGEAHSGVEAVQLCQMTTPDILLLDFRTLPDHGRELAAQIHHRWPKVKVVVLLGSQEQSQSADEPDATPVYYFSRDVSEEEFKEALLHVHQDACCRDVPGVQASFGHLAPSESPEEVQDTLRLLQQRPRGDESLARELVMAGKIQSDILPEEAPSIPGWEVSARLEPARETSGDFYDFIPLTDRKWGLVVGDVTDKGMGAALFMAMTSSLLRTYATRFPTLPALTLRAVSQRILSDTRGNMFVTAFFGALEPHTGRFLFANAGHPPGFLISSQKGKVSIDSLRPTGMALGVSEQALWKQKMVRFNPGDYLILYTDGITEAQSPQGAFFGEERLLDAALGRVGSSARGMQSGLMDAVHRFVGNAAPQDDIALIVIRRDK